MSREDIQTMLVEVLKNFTTDQKVWESPVTGDTELIKDLKIKSARIVDVILEIEDRLDIEVDPDEMDNMFTVGETVNILHRLLNSN